MHSRKDNPFIHGPLRRKWLFPKEWLEIAIKITFQFEGEGYASVTGNFDGQGLSVGGLQWNYGQGSLQSKILQPFINQFGAEALDSFFPSPTSHSAYMSPKEAKKFSVKTMQDKKWSLRGPRYKVKSDWRRCWKNFLASDPVVEIQKKACESVASQAYEYCYSYGLLSVRSFCFFFDVVTQNGSMKGIPLPTVTQEIYLDSILTEGDENYEAWLKAGHTREVMCLWLLICARAKRNKWRKDVLMRKGTIAHGMGEVHNTDFDFREELTPYLNDCILKPRKFHLSIDENGLLADINAMYWSGDNLTEVMRWLSGLGHKYVDVQNKKLSIPGVTKDFYPGNYICNPTGKRLITINSETFEKNYKRVQ